jgi:hypothetical protein
METMSPSPEQLPPPTGLPVPVEMLGNLPIDPTVPQTVELIGPDGFRFSVLKNPNTATTTFDAVTDLPTTDTPDFHDRSSELVDAGVIDLVPLGEVVDSAKISYHGLKYSLARTRENRARARVERMNRKDAQYSELARSADVINRPLTDGDAAVLGKAGVDAFTDSAISVIKPETKVEKHMDRRLDKKRQKALEKDLDRRIVAKGYTSKTDRAGATRMNKLGQKTAIALSSDMTASEKRHAKHKINAQKTISPTNTQRVIGRKSEKAEKKFDRASRQPIASRWRALRRATAQRSADRHQRRADKHLQKAIDIENSRP